MRTSESGPSAPGSPKGHHDDQLSVRRSSANLGNPGRSFGLPPVRLPARRDARDPGAGPAADPAGRGRKNQVRALGIGRRCAHPLVLVRRLANSARAAQAGSDAGRHRRVPRGDAGNRHRQHRPDLRADRPDHDRGPPDRRGRNGDCRRARHESVRRPALKSNRAAAGGAQHSGRGRGAMSARRRGRRTSSRAQARSPRRPCRVGEFAPWRQQDRS